MDDRARGPADLEVRRQLDRWMRRSSLAVSIAAGLAMLLGLGSLIVTGTLESFAKEPAIAVGALRHPARAPLGLYATSLGIVLLSLLPALRVLLAAALYAGRRALLDAGVALLVLVELIVSMLTGRG
jgi:uncharacterized membrane protein